MAREVDPKIAARDKDIAEQRRNGTASLGVLAVKYGISRERVRQIANQQGVDPKKARSHLRSLKSDAAFEEAEKHAGAILMRYIAGDAPSDMAKSMGLQVKAVQEVLDEQITDEVIAARARNRTARLFPGADAGPKSVNEPRHDRFWTPERVRDALVQLAKQHGGRLPSSTQYQQLAPTRDDLPSFATVRNRLGRWSAIRVEINRLAR